MLDRQAEPLLQLIWRVAWPDNQGNTVRFYQAVLLKAVIHFFNRQSKNFTMLNFFDL
jgi:hypothetical protein